MDPTAAAARAPVPATATATTGQNMEKHMSSSSSSDGSCVRCIHCTLAADLIRSAYSTSTSTNVLFVVTTDASCHGSFNASSRNAHGNKNVHGNNGNNHSSSFNSDDRSSSRNGGSDDEQAAAKKQSGIAVVVRQIGGTRLTASTGRGTSYSDTIDVDIDDDSDLYNSYRTDDNETLIRKGNDKIKIVLASTSLQPSNAAETYAWNIGIKTLLLDNMSRSLLAGGHATVLLLSDNRHTIEFYKRRCNYSSQDIPPNVAVEWKKNFDDLMRLMNSDVGRMDGRDPYSTMQSSSSSVRLSQVRGLRDDSFAPFGFFDHSAADLLSAIARYEQPKFDRWRSNIPTLEEVDILWLENSHQKSLPKMTSTGKRKVSVQEMIRLSWGIDLVPLLKDGYNRNIHPVMSNMKKRKGLAFQSNNPKKRLNVLRASNAEERKKPPPPPAATLAPKMVQTSKKKSSKIIAASTKNAKKKEIPSSYSFGSGKSSPTGCCRVPSKPCKGSIETIDILHDNDEAESSTTTTERGSLEDKPTESYIITFNSNHDENNKKIIESTANGLKEAYPNTYAARSAFTATSATGSAVTTSRNTRNKNRDIIDLSCDSDDDSCRQRR